MRVTAYVVPPELLVGDPPQRLFDQVFVWPDGTVSTRTIASDRKIVFDDLEALGKAFTPEPVPASVIEAAWRSRSVEVDSVPCKACRTEYREGEDHASTCVSMRRVSTHEPSSSY